MNQTVITVQDSARSPPRRHTLVATATRRPGITVWAAAVVRRHDLHRLTHNTEEGRVMERLVPPEIPPPDRTLAELDPIVPAGGITRNDVLAQYRRAMREPLPESKTLTGALRGWSGALATRQWFGGRYTPTGALVMRSPKVCLDDADTTHSVVTACVEVVEPLSRYTAGWCDSLDSLSPKGLGNPVGTAVREARRFAEQRVRAAMTEQEPTVHDSWESVAAFVAEPSTRHMVDEQIALNAFVTKIVLLIDKGVTGKHTLTEAETGLLGELGDQIINELGAVPDEPVTPERLAELRAQAIEFLERVVAERFAGARYKHDHMPEAFERVVTTYINRLRVGKPLEGTEFYLKLRLGAVRVDEWRRLDRLRRKERDLVAGDDPDSGRAGDRIEDSTAPSSSIEAGDLLGSARAKIAADPSNRDGGTLSWEAKMALSILDGGSDTEQMPTQRDLRAFVADRWNTEQPNDSRSSSGQAAAMHVLLLMETAVNQARRDLDAEFGTGEAS